LALLVKRKPAAELPVLDCHTQDVALLKSQAIIVPAIAKIVNALQMYDPSLLETSMPLNLDFIGDLTMLNNSINIHAV
jgi:hypothetical protein